MRQARALLSRGTGPIATIVADAAEAGIIVPSIARRLLAEAGFAFDVEQRKHTTRLRITRLATPEDELDGAPPGSQVVVAQAISHDEEDALLQAIFGVLKEENVGRSPMQNVKAIADASAIVGYRVTSADDARAILRAHKGTR
jgi:hypothetical protein